MCACGQCFSVFFENINKVRNMKANESLYKAALERDESEVKRHLQASHKPDSGGVSNKTPLMVVLGRPSLGLAEDDEFGERPRLGIVHSLLSAGANVNARDSFRDSALHYNLKNHYYTAQEINFAETEIITDTLIRAGALVNATNDGGETPLFNAACMNENLGSVRLLLKAGVDVDVKNDEGQTALMKAVLSNSGKVVEELLNAGANVNVQDDEGLTALAHCALPYRFPYRNKVVTLINLLSKGADPTKNDEDGVPISEHVFLDERLKPILLTMEKKKSFSSFSRKCVGERGLQFACKQAIVESVCRNNKDSRINFKDLNLPLPTPIINFLSTREEYEIMDEDLNKIGADLCMYIGQLKSQELMNRYTSYLKGLHE